MRYAAFVLIFILVLMGAGIHAEDDGLMNLLDSLKSDKKIEEKYKDKSEDQLKPEQKRRDPSEVLKEIKETMDRVTKKIEEKKIDRENVLKDQEKVVSLIDELLKEAVARSGGRAGSSQKQQQQKQQKILTLPSNTGTGTSSGGGGSGAGSTDNKKPDDDGGRDEQWGNLPEGVRQDIMQIMQEDIPLLYKELLRLYFKNLDRE